MTTGAAGQAGDGGGPGPAPGTATLPAPVDRRAERAARRRAAASRRAAWYGDRWWAPGVVVAAGTAVVGWAVTRAWRLYEAGGCSDVPGAKFACLMEALVGAALAVVLGPLLLWLAYRAVGVRRPLLSVVVAVALAWVLLAAPELVSEVRVLLGVDRPLDPWLALGVGAVLGLAALGGGLALQGPRRLVRAGAAGAAVAAMVVSVVVLSGPAERAELRLDLARVEVPLLLPGPGWEVGSFYVGEGGTLSYDIVPVGFDGYAFEGRSLDISADLRGFGDTCSFRACTDVGDVRVEVPEPGDDVPPTAWRVVDGHLVTLGAYSSDGIEMDPVQVLSGMVPATVEEVLDRQFRDPCC